MSVLPMNRLDQVEFCESHWPVWEANAAAIGLTTAQTGALKSATTSARAKYDASLAARQASKAATQAFYGATAAMRDLAAPMIAAIKSFADQQADPGAVYVLAQIPPPAAPTPAAAPGKPTNFTVTLEPTGAVTLLWDATNAAASSGAFFQVSRKLPGAGSFVSIGGAPGSTAESRRMTFTDETVPASAASAGVQYIVTGRRGSLTGVPSDAVTVQFGVDGSGFAVTGGQAGGNFKIAA